MFACLRSNRTDREFDPSRKISDLHSSFPLGDNEAHNKKKRVRLCHHSSSRYPPLHSPAMVLSLLFAPFLLPLSSAPLSWGLQGSRLFNRRYNSLFSLVSFANAQSDKEYKSRDQLSRGDWAKAHSSVSQAEQAGSKGAEIAWQDGGLQSEREKSSSTSVDRRVTEKEEKGRCVDDFLFSFLSSKPAIFLICTCIDSIAVMSWFWVSRPVIHGALSNHQSAPFVCLPASLFVCLHNTLTLIPLFLVSP